MEALLEFASQNHIWRLVMLRCSWLYLHVAFRGCCCELVAFPKLYFTYKAALKPISNWFSSVWHNFVTIIHTRPNSILKKRKRNSPRLRQSRSTASWPSLIAKAIARIQHLCKESSSTSSFSPSLPAPRGKPKASNPATEQGKKSKAEKLPRKRKPGCYHHEELNFENFYGRPFFWYPDPHSWHFHHRDPKPDTAMSKYTKSLMSYRGNVQIP